MILIIYTLLYLTGLIRCWCKGREQKRRAWKPWEREYFTADLEKKKYHRGTWATPRCQEWIFHHTFALLKIGELLVCYGILLWNQKCMCLFSFWTTIITEYVLPTLADIHSCPSAHTIVPEIGDDSQGGSFEKEDRGGKAQVTKLITRRTSK